MTPEVVDNLDYWISLIASADPVACDLGRFLNRYQEALDAL